MTYKLSNFLGINNRLPDFSLHIRTRQVSGDYLRDAVNVDIDNSGRLLHRKVPQLVQAMTGAHSIHMTSATAGYLVRDSVLYSIVLPTYAETLLRVLSSNAAMSYVKQGADVFYSNGTDSGRITAGVVYPLALPTPAKPTASGIGGGLPAGLYQVAVSYARYGSGGQTAATLLEEGGVSDRLQMEITATGGLRVTLPAATTGVTHINVYLTAANGEMPQLAAVVATGTATVDLVALAEGREATSRRDEPLPAGRLFMSSGRLCSIKGKNLYIGHPYRPGYYDPLAGYVPFSADISIAIDAQTGIFVAADITRWIPNEGPTADVLPYGAVPGTEFIYPDRSIYGWFGAKGIVLVTRSGEVDAAMSDEIELTAPTSGFSTIFEDGEFRKVVSCGWCMNLTNKAVTRYEDWGFTSFSGGYGTMSDGIYALEAGGAVEWSVDFGKVDLGSDALKHLPNAYLGVQSDDLMQLRVQAPGRYGGDYTYPARGFSEDLSMQRIDIGKGLRATWFELSLSGQNGADFSLASIDFPAATTTRRI